MEANITEHKEYYSVLNNHQVILDKVKGLPPKIFQNVKSKKFELEKISNKDLQDLSCYLRCVKKYALLGLTLYKNDQVDKAYSLWIHLRELLSFMQADLLVTEILLHITSPQLYTLKSEETHEFISNKINEILSNNSIIPFHNIFEIVETEKQRRIKHKKDKQAKILSMQQNINISNQMFYQQQNQQYNYYNLLPFQNAYYYPFPFTPYQPNYDNPYYYPYSQNNFYYTTPTPTTYFSEEDYYADEEDTYYHPY